MSMQTRGGDARVVDAVSSGREGEGRDSSGEMDEKHRVQDNARAGFDAAQRHAGKEGAFDETAGLSKSGKPRPSRRGFFGGMAGGALIGMTAGATLGYRASPPVVTLDAGKHLAGKVAMVTGGTSGIGKASVFALARAGAQVVFCGRREALGEEIANEVRATGGSARFIRCDVRDEGQIRAFFSSILSQEGRLDIAFNNAGIYANHPFHEMPTDVFDDVQRTNVRGIFLCMKEEIPIMLRQGSGVIIVNSSVQDLATRDGSAAYGPSKRAIIGLMRSAALEYGGRGIRVNALCPGATDTPMVRPANLPAPAWGLAAKQWGERHVHGMGRLGQPEELANAVLWMASDEMSYLNGASIVVDGGMTTAL